MIKKKIKMWQFVASAWFYAIAASWNAETEREALKWALSLALARRCSSFTLIAQDLAVCWDELGRDAEEDAASSLPGHPITAAFTSSHQAQEPRQSCAVRAA